MFSFEDVKQYLPDFTYEPIDVNGTPGALVSRDTIVGVAKVLKEKFEFLQLIDAFGYDHNQRKGRFEVTYSVRNHKTKVSKVLACGLIAFHVDAAVSDALDKAPLSRRILDWLRPNHERHTKSSTR